MLNAHSTVFLLTLPLLREAAYSSVSPSASSASAPTSISTSTSTFVRNRVAQGIGIAKVFLGLQCRLNYKRTLVSTDLSRCCFVPGSFMKSLTPCLNPSLTAFQVDPLPSYQSCSLLLEDILVFVSKVVW